MSKFFRSASRLNKIKYSFQLSVDIKTLRLHPMHNDKEVILTLTKGGRKSVNTPHPRKPGGPWNESLSLVASLYRDSHGRYQEKKYTLAVKQAGTGKTLATFTLDASHFASAAGTKEACEFQSVNPKDDGRLGVEVTCAFLRQLESQGSEVSSMVSSIVGDEDDDMQDEQDLSGWGSGGAVEGSGGEAAASPAATILPESSSSPSSFPSSPTTSISSSSSSFPSSSSSSSMPPPPAPVVGLAHMASQGRMRFIRRSMDLRPPRPAPSSPTKPQAGDADVAAAIRERDNLQKRLTQLEETHAVVLAQKRAVDEEAQTLRTERQREQQLQRKEAADKEEAVLALQQRVADLDIQVKDRDGELARMQGVLDKKEVEIVVAREREAQLKAEVQEAEEGWEKLRRAKGEREAEFQAAEAATAAELERLQNELFITKASISSPQRQPRPQVVEKEKEEGEEEEEGSEEHADVAAAVATAAAATAAAAKAKETTRVVTAKLEAVEKERVALLADKTELTEGLKEIKAGLEKARARRDQVEQERSALATRLAEMEEHEQQHRAQHTAALEKRKVEVEALRIQVQELEEVCRAATERAIAAEASVVEVGEAKARLAAELDQARQRLAATAGEQGEQEQVLEEQRGQWAGEKEGLTARVAELEASSRAAKTEVEEALQSLSQAKEEAATAATAHATEMAAVGAEKERLSKQVQGLEAEKTRLLKEIEEERQHWVAEGGAEAQGHEKQRAQWAAEKDELLARVEEVEAALEAVRQEGYEGRRRAAVEQEEKAAAWVVEKQGMATRLLAVEGDKARLVAALEEERQRRADEVGEEEEGRAAWVEEKASLLARVAELEVAVEAAREEAAALQEEATDAWRSLAQAKEDVDAHAAAERELERSLQLLQTQVIHGEGDVRAAREARAEADSEAAGALDRLGELEEEMGGVVEERDMYQEGLVEAKLKIAQLMEQLDELSFQLQHLNKGK